MRWKIFPRTSTTLRTAMAKNEVTRSSTPTYRSINFIHASFTPLRKNRKGRNQRGRKFESPGGKSEIRSALGGSESQTNPKFEKGKSKRRGKIFDLEQEFLFAFFPISDFPLSLTFD